MNSSNLMLPYLAAGQAQKHVTVNESLLRLDALVQCVVRSRTVTAQPASPTDGHLYILPAGKTGSAWGAMAAGALAYYRDGVWEEVTPRDGWTAYVRDEARHVAFGGVTWAALATVRPDAARNRLLNAAFAINQRNASSAGDDAYGFDRWYVLTQTGSVSLSALSHPEAGRATGVRLTQPDVTAKRIGLAQIVESANIADLRTLAVAMAARVRCSASQAIRMAILEWTGTADAVTSDAVQDWTSSTYTPSNFFIAGVNVIACGASTPAASTWTDLTPLAGSFGASANNAIVMIWTEGVLAQSATLDIDQVQLEADSCTAFVTRPIGAELALCQRYFYRWGHENADAGTGFRMFGYGKASVFEGQTIRHPVTMRTVPALTKAGTWSVTNCGQPGVSDPSTQSCSIFVQVTADGSFDFYPSGANDYIQADAEL